jgi:MoaA/NifB/PqqE/SkfB family radical SAM enzyme
MKPIQYDLKSDSPDVLGILLTTNCNLSCRHCCNDSGPTRHTSLNFEEIQKVIFDARNVSSIKEIGISGGEPFLKMELLRETVKYASSFGFGVSVTSNGFWGQAAGSKKLLSSLQRDGLTSVCISTSVYHQEFVPLGRVVMAARTSVDLGLTTTINVVKSASLSIEEVKNEFGSLANELNFVVMPCLPTGRASLDVSVTEFEFVEASPYGNCRAHFRKLAIDTVGEVYPCCSPGGFTPPLRLGNVKNSGIASIVLDSYDNPLIAILEEVGPTFFLPFLRTKMSDKDIPHEFADQCHLCHYMLSEPELASIVLSACDQFRTEISSLPEEERKNLTDRMKSLLPEAA